MENILVTGCAGFIGYHLSKALLGRRFKVIGVDSLNNYYDPELKKARLKDLQTIPNFSFCHENIQNLERLEEIVKKNRITYIYHLAAQAGVRYSLENPHAYIDANVTGHLNILQCAQKYKVKHLFYASSSSVYGANIKVPFSEADEVRQPISLYAATKIAGEALSQSYFHMYGLASTGFRFFTVYGPWGRPDMAIYKFTEAIIKGKPITVYNNGDMYRDFTYIDDIIAGLVAAFDNVKKFAGNHSVINIGNNKPEKLSNLVSLLEKHIGVNAIIDYQPLQPGDMLKTYADINKAKDLLRFAPQTSLDEGLGKFVAWYKGFNIAKSV